MNRGSSHPGVAIDPGWRLESAPGSSCHDLLYRPPRRAPLGHAEDYAAPSDWQNYSTAPVVDDVGTNSWIVLFLLQREVGQSQYTLGDLRDEASSDADRSAK